MKINLLLLSCLILVGCERPATNPSTTKPTGAVRWAFANKRDIDSALFKWSQTQSEDFNASEKLSPEIEEKVRQYQSLQGELSRKQMEKRMAAMGARIPQRPGTTPEALISDADEAALSKQVAEAKAPVADIVERRARQAAKFRDQYSADKLIGEYAKGRFDLVVDSSDERSSRSAVLYRTAFEVLDITDGIIKSFQDKAKP